MIKRETCLNEIFNKHYSKNIQSNQTNTTSNYSTYTYDNNISNGKIDVYQYSNANENANSDVFVQHNKNIELTIFRDITITLLECYNGTLKELCVERNTYISYNNEIVTVHKDKQKETLVVEIKNGVLNNEKIVIKNKGHCVHNKGNVEYGDLIINVVVDVLKLTSLVDFFNISSKIKLNEKDYYEKQSNNLIFHKHISLKEALCGFDFIVPHLNREFYRIKSSPTVVFYEGKIQYINKNGFVRNSICGDFLIHYHVIFPESLDTNAILQLRQLL